MAASSVPGPVTGESRGGGEMRDSEGDHSCSLTRDQPICGAFDEEEDEEDEDGEEESLHHDIYGLDALT
ncbi:hypothetical protein Sjap_008434 [Stephania japonica]|uniref:Uncharacterized protein n=1 Tax=Stephania japonica TaxID=461633 RepID=A0AAP0JQB2_9MAGN